MYTKVLVDNLNDIKDWLTLIDMLIIILILSIEGLKLFSNNDLLFPGMFASQF